MKKVLLIVFVVIAGAGKQAIVNPQKRTFIFNNDTISQKVEILFYDTLSGNKNEKIFFKIYTENKLTKTTFTLADTAYFNFYPEAPDFAEYEDDIKDEMYPAIEFIYYKKCWLTIGIDYLRKDRLFIKEWNCEGVHQNGCPLGSIGTLRRIAN